MPNIERDGYETDNRSSTVTRYYCDGSESVSNSSSSVNTDVSRYKKSWTRTPNYRQLVRSKSRLPDNNFDVEQWRLSTGTVTYTETIYPNPCTGFGGTERMRRTVYTRAPFTYIKQVAGVKSLSSNSCISQLLSRARGAEFSVPIFVGEARSTVNMVLSTAHTLATTYRSLRSGNLRGAYQALGLGAPTGSSRRRFNRQFGVDPSRAAANRWLELQYGWIPLLADVKNAAETLAETMSESASREGRVTARSNLNSVTNQTVGVEVSPTGTARRIRNQQESYRAVWRFEPNALSVPASLGLLNPLQVAWELIPLSFVIDWFLPIGRYLEQLDTPYRFKHVGGSIGYRREVSQHYDQFVRNDAPGQGTYQTSYLYVERRKLDGPPSLGLESVWFDPNVGVRRLFSGLALARQAFR